MFSKQENFSRKIMREYKYFLDTNIFLRSIVKDDLQKTNDCEKLFDLIEQDKIKTITSSIVLAELVWTSISFYKIPKKQIIKILRGILKLKRLKFSHDCNIFSAIAFYEKYNVKFVDAIIAANTFLSKKNVKIISYDRDFDKLSITRIEPNELIKKF